MTNAAYVHPKSGNLMSPVCRMIWPSLFAPTKMREQAEDQAKHQITILIPKDADITALQTAAKDAATEKFGAKKTTGIRSPFRKTEEKDKLAEFAEDYPFYITARSKDKPGVVGPSGKAVDDPEQVYSGRHCRVSMQAFAYDTAGNKGVSFGLQNVQLLDHDDPLNVGGGRVAAESEFDAVEGVSGNDGASADDIFG